MTETEKRLRQIEHLLGQQSTLPGAILRFEYLTPLVRHEIPWLVAKVRELERLVVEIDMEAERLQDQLRHHED